MQFMVIESLNHWTSEEGFVKQFRGEVIEGEFSYDAKENSQDFLKYIRSNPVPVGYLFLSGIFSLIDSRSSMGRENREVAYWFSEHRKLDSCIILSDIFRLGYIDTRLRSLVTHRFRVAGVGEVVSCRAFTLLNSKGIRFKLGEVPILKAIEELNIPEAIGFDEPDEFGEEEGEG